MSYETIARRYARAIFELGKETSSLAQVTRDIADFAAMYASSAELRNVLDNPLIGDESREGVILELGKRMNASEIALNAVRLVGRRRKLPVLPDIARELQRLVNEEVGLVRAVVTSAGPLSDGYLAKLQTEIEKALGKRVAIDHQQDPALIAGVITRIGDLVIDGSVRSRLSSFRDSLLRT